MGHEHKNLCRMLYMAFISIMLHILCEVLLAVNQTPKAVANIL